MFNRRRSAVIFILGAIAALFLAAAPSSAQTPKWPQRPVKFIIPLGPGAGADIVARLFGDPSSLRLHPCPRALQ